MFKIISPFEKQEINLQVTKKKSLNAIKKKLPQDAINPAHGPLLRVNSRKGRNFQIISYVSLTVTLLLFTFSIIFTRAGISLQQLEEY